MASISACLSRSACVETCDHAGALRDIRDWIGNGARTNAGAQSPRSTPVTAKPAGSVARTRQHGYRTAARVSSNSTGLVLDSGAAHFQLQLLRCRLVHSLDGSGDRRELLQRQPERQRRLCLGVRGKNISIIRNGGGYRRRQFLRTFAGRGAERRRREFVRLSGSGAKLGLRHLARFIGGLSTGGRTGEFIRFTPGGAWALQRAEAKTLFAVHLRLTKVQITAARGIRITAGTRSGPTEVEGPCRSALSGVDGRHEVPPRPRVCLGVVVFDASADTARQRRFRPSRRRRSSSELGDRRAIFHQEAM